MVERTSSAWLGQHLMDSGVRVVDTRPPVKYLSGHVPGAVNFPLWRTLDQHALELRSEDELSLDLGNAGIDLSTKVVLCDDYDGQSAAMLAWALEYLGHKNVGILSEYVERWATEGGEILYRPVKAEPRKFDVQLNPAVRMMADDIPRDSSIKLLDLRSKDEFQAKLATESRSGHIPRAFSLPWTGLLGQEGKFLRPREELERIFTGVGLKITDRVVTYCSYGPRAAVGYAALQQAGFINLLVYDGSFHQWGRRRDLPVEGEGLQIQLQ